MLICLFLSVTLMCALSLALTRLLLSSFILSHLSFIYRFFFFFVNLWENYFFLPLFFAGVQSVAKDKMDSSPMDEDPRLDSPPKCEAFLIDVHVMPPGELYRY